MSHLKFIRPTLRCLFAFTLLLTAGSKGSASAAPAAVRLTPVPIHHVVVDDSFWSPKLTVFRRTTINDCFDKFEHDGAFENFDHVAKSELTASHGGDPWHDGLVYQMIRAAADFIAEHPDPALEARVDGYIARIVAAADKDPEGYVNTYTQLKEPTHRWGANGGNDLWQHDLYNAGLLVDAGVHYYRATGKTPLLNAGVRIADLMSKTMGPPPRQNIIPGHAAAEEAMVGLYHLLKQQPDLESKLSAPVDGAAYLSLAKFWIDARGHHDGRKDFKAYDQDDVPVSQQNDIEGHAVRATLLASGVTAAGMASDDAAYLDVSRRWWTSMVGRRMYLTGGVGSFAAEEKFGPDYVLPNTGYAETCAAVGTGFFAENMNLATGDAAAADELERTLYNGALSGVSVAGNRYFYENPLQADRKRARWAWHGCPCCPPMFLKLMSALPGYVYATDDVGGFYVNLLIGSKATTEVSGTAVTVTQTTQYPAAGDAKFVVDPVKPTTFDFYVRVPGWCRGGPSTGGLYNTAPVGPDSFKIKVGGQAVSPEIVRGYARIHREWRAGDVVGIEMAMPVRRVTADARVEADKGRVALMRGPLVYCAESVDNAGRIEDLFVPDDAAITTETKADLLGGVTVLHAAGRRLKFGGGDEPAEVVLIPYYTNANRGPVSMAVWLPSTAAAGATAPTIASLATPSASYSNPGDTLFAMNDGLTPKSSADESVPRFTWWDHRGTAEWVQYDLDRPRTVSSVDVYWWDETRIKRQCRVPQSWRLLYRRPDGSWSPVPGKPEFSTNKDAFDTAKFDPVETNGLRIEVQLQPDHSGGILEWRVGS